MKRQLIYGALIVLVALLYFFKPKPYASECRPFRAENERLEKFFNLT